MNSDILGVIFAVTISLLMIPTWYTYSHYSTSMISATFSAQQMQLITTAAQGYISNTGNAANLITLTASGPISLTLTQLQTGGYLPPSFNTSMLNSYGQSYAVQVSQPSAGILQGIVYTTGGNQESTNDLIKTAHLIGTQGGFVPTSTISYSGQSVNTTTIIGSEGGWSLTAPSAVTAGHLVSLISYNINNNQVNNYLYRSSVVGQPQLNQMQTNIDMNNNQLNNVNSITSQIPQNVSLNFSGFGATENVSQTGNGVSLWNNASNNFMFGVDNINGMNEGFDTTSSSPVYNFSNTTTAVLGGACTPIGSAGHYTVQMARDSSTSSLLICNTTNNTWNGVASTNAYHGSQWYLNPNNATYIFTKPVNIIHIKGCAEGGAGMVPSYYYNSNPLVTFSGISGQSGQCFDQDIAAFTSTSPLDNTIPIGTNGLVSSYDSISQNVSNQIVSISISNTSISVPTGPGNGLRVAVTYNNGVTGTYCFEGGGTPSIYAWQFNTANGLGGQTNEATTSFPAWSVATSGNGGFAGAIIKATIDVSCGGNLSNTYDYASTFSYNNYSNWSSPYIYIPIDAQLYATGNSSIVGSAGATTSTVPNAYYLDMNVLNWSKSMYSSVYTNYIDYNTSSAFSNPPNPFGTNQIIYTTPVLNSNTLATFYYQLNKNGCGEGQDESHNVNQATGSLLSWFPISCISVTW